MKSIRLVAAAFAALLATSAIAEAQTTTTPPRATRPAATPAPTAPATTTEAPKVKKPASAAQLRQRQKMRDCGAEWQGIKKAKTEKGRTWRVFSKECLSRKA